MPASVCFACFGVLGLRHLGLLHSKSIKALQDQERTRAHRACFESFYDKKRQEIEPAAGLSWSCHIVSGLLLRCLESRSLFDQKTNTQSSLTCLACTLLASLVYWVAWNYFEVFVSPKPFRVGSEKRPQSLRSRWHLLFPSDSQDHVLFSCS